MKLTLTMISAVALALVGLPASALASSHSKVLGEGMSSTTSSSMMQGKTGHVVHNIAKDFGVTPKHRQVDLERWHLSPNHLAFCRKYTDNHTCYMRISRW